MHYSLYTYTIYTCTYTAGITLPDEAKHEIASYPCWITITQCTSLTVAIVAPGKTNSNLKEHFN